MAEGRWTSAKPPLGGLRPGRRRLTRHRGGCEVALEIALAAQVEVIPPGPKEATAVKMPLDPPDRTLQYIAHLAGLQMPKAGKDKLAALLVPSAVQNDCMQMRVEAQIGGCPLYRGDCAGLCTDGALLRRSTGIKRLHRVREDLGEPSEQLTVLREPWSPWEREGQHPLPQRG